jgi:hypothetical protein
MDEQIRIVVDKTIDFIKRDANINGSFRYWIDHFDGRNKVFDHVLSKKDKFDPTKGNLNGYFSTLARHYILLIYKKDQQSIETIMERERRINELLGI